MKFWTQNNGENSGLQGRTLRDGWDEHFDEEAQIILTEPTRYQLSRVMNYKTTAWQFTYVYHSDVEFCNICYKTFLKMSNI